VWFIDADVTVPPDAARRVLEFFAGNPHAALFGSYDDTPSQPGLLSQYRNLLHHYTHQHGCPEAGTFWAGCGVFRRDLFLTLGGFDPTFTRPSVEDIELGLRARRAGYAIRLDKTLLCTHHKTWRTATLIRDDITRRAAPWARLLLRERRIPNDLNLARGQRVSVVLAGLLPAALMALAKSTSTALPALACCTTGLLLLNADFYRFLAYRRGLWFAVRAIPCHWLYFICAGCGGLLGTIQFLTRPAPVTRNG
jgi:GT2 family glycosyltransferase